MGLFGAHKAEKEFTCICCSLVAELRAELSSACFTVGSTRAPGGCSLLYHLSLQLCVGFYMRSNGELLSSWAAFSFPICFLKIHWGGGGVWKGEVAKLQLNVRVMNTTGLHGLYSSAPHVILSNSVLMTWSHTTLSMRPLPCLLNRLDNIQLVNSFSIVCILLIAQCMVLCLHCWLLFIPCSEDLIAYFLQSFSMVLITIISQRFTNIV